MDNDKICKISQGQFMPKVIKPPNTPNQQTLCIETNIF